MEVDYEKIGIDTNTPTFNRQDIQGQSKPRLLGSKTKIIAIQQVVQDAGQGPLAYLRFMILAPISYSLP